MKRWAALFLMMVLLLAGLSGLAEEGEPAYLRENWYEFKCGEAAEKYALFDPFNIRVTDYIFDDVDIGVVRPEKAPFAVRQGDVWGYIDVNGEAVIPFQFDSAHSFDGDLAAAKQDGKWGFINRAGDWVVKPKYTGVRHGGEGFREGLCSVRLKGKWGFVNQAGEQVIDPVYEDVQYFSMGLCPVQKKGKWGYINADGRLVIKPVYEDAFPFFSDDNGCAEVCGKNGLGLIDREGRLLIPCEYEEIGFEDDGCTVACETGDGMAYYVLSKGKATPLKTLTAAIEIDDYKPFESDRLATLDEKETLTKRVSDETLPRLDGAIALLPVYAAFAQALYPADTRYDETDEGDGPLITCTNTRSAYERLIHREADVIFVAQPSDEELAMAAAAGVAFDMIPFGKEAFVFFVNRDNPLTGVTLEQLRQVYSGQITQWSDLGVNGLGSIVAYQRPKNSGSQSTMEALMGDTPLMDAPEGVVAFGMGDILNVVEYRNQPNAMGYSFRYFSTGLTGSQVKLLRVDGVPPLEANIRAGLYPITSTLYAIRLKDNDNPNVRAFLDWMQGPQGMELVEKTGYTPWTAYDSDGQPVSDALPEAWDEQKKLTNAALWEASGGDRMAMGDEVDPFNYDYTLARQGEKWALLDADGRVLLRPCMDWPEGGDCPFMPIGEHGVAGIVKVDGLYGLIGENGAWLLPAEYETIDFFFDDPRLHVVKKDGKWGYLADDGSLLTEAVFDEIDWSADDGALHVVREGLHGYLRRDGTWLVEPAYENAAERFTEGHAAVKQDGRWGYLNADGQLGIPCRFYSAEPFMNLYAVVRGDKDKTGVINAQGEYVLEPDTYENVERVDEKFVVLTKTTKTKKGKKKAEKLYYNLYPDGAVPVSQDAGDQLQTGRWQAFEYGGRYGVEDGNGRCVLEPVYAEVHVSLEDESVTAIGADGTKRVFDLSNGAARELATVGADFTLDDYLPFEGKKVAVPGEKATLAKALKKGKLPRLDGATALFPVYSALVQAAYPKDTRFEAWNGENAPTVTCTKTSGAYERLIDGEADVIFVAQPSDEELALAAERGVEFELTPFGREAFVFFVNRDNPLEDISLDQIRRIYSGEITTWDELWVPDLGKIVAYQRPKNSGSQTALESLMGDTPLMDPPQGVVAWDMGDIVDAVEYRNRPNAIGYSFRFYCTEMLDSAIRLLSIDGVAPTEENIRNGSYPVTSALYAVTLKGNENPNVQALIDWLAGEQGQKLVEQCGYTGWE